MRGFLVASRENDITRAFTSQILTTAASPAHGTAPPFAFVFTGQGSQWPGMCRELFSEFSVFKNAISEMDSVLRTIPHSPSWSLKDAIMDIENPELMHTPQRSQPCCTAIQVALVQLLESWGIFPEMTVGHSSGEIAGAFAAGHISAAEAIVIAYYRGHCVSRNTQDGSMMAAGLSEGSAAEAISNLGLEENLRVACVNSPEGVTVSGDSEAIDKLLGVLQEKSAFARKLKTGGQAYHSHHMLLFGDEYQSLLDTVLPTLAPSFKLPTGLTTVMSSVTGRPKISNFTSCYWRSNLESQVRFSEAIHQINSHSKHYFIEIGPHSSLELPIKQTLAKDCVAATAVKYGAPIKRNTNALESTLSFAGNLWLNGCDINWSKVNGLQTPWKSSKSLFRVLTDLPPYRFSYENMLWTECRASTEYRHRKYPRHELLGTLMPGGNGDNKIFRNLIKVDEIDWLKDHKLEETVVFPGTGYLAAVMEAIMQATDVDRTAKPSFEFSNVNILNALVFSSEHASQTEFFTSLQRSPITNAATSSKWWDFSISSYQDGSSLAHAKGSISISVKNIVMTSKYQAPIGCLEPSATRTWYEKLIRQGLNFGPAFQSISEFQIPRMKSSSFCSAKAPLLTVSGDVLSVYPIHP